MTVRFCLFQISIEMLPRLQNCFPLFCRSLPVRMKQTIALKSDQKCESSEPKKLARSVVPKFKFDKVVLKNEPILEYLPESVEIKKLEEALKCVESRLEEIPIVINGKEIRCGKEMYQYMPHRRTQKVAKFFYADKQTICDAIDVAVEKQKQWDKVPIPKRIRIWEKAADLMATKYRADLLATTMLGQAKTVYQAEIDAAAELIDFTRMHAGYLKEVAMNQPLSPNPDVIQNHLVLRGLEGFVTAVTPFNFTAIGGNLAYTPALMGNAVLWKPSDCAVLSNWKVFQIMREAGVPDGVVNFVPADGKFFSEITTYSPEFAGVNFTGSTAVFNAIWKNVSKNIDSYNNYPRLVGECGGKNFHFVHPSAHVETVVSTTIRSAFEYGGQKCSACSRLYVPESLWESKIKKPLIQKTTKLVLGDVSRYDTFFSAVINENSFQKMLCFINEAKQDKDCKIIAGGRLSNLKGYFVEPTIVLVNAPDNVLMKEEIFGPILAVYVYKDSELENTLDLVNETTRYGLTGSVFATDEEFLKHALLRLRNAAGNLYINDKCTGAVVGQQPFGGARFSGTNDKAGGPFYVLRWSSLQIVKETFVPMTDINYPYMNVC